MVCPLLQVSLGKLQVCHVFWKYLLLYLISGKGLYAFSVKCSGLVIDSRICQYLDTVLY
jgi:hypothetical protein